MQVEESAGRHSCAQFHACPDAASADLNTSAAGLKRQTFRIRENGFAEIGKTDLQKSKKQTSKNLRFRFAVIDRMDLQKSWNQTVIILR